MKSSKILVDYIDNNYNKIDGLNKPICDMSNNDKIKCKENAYNFDKIKEAICGDKTKSCDVLYIKRDINLIEFKTGFDAPERNDSDRQKKENMKQSIQIKAGDSLHILEKFLLKKPIVMKKIGPKK